MGTACLPLCGMLRAKQTERYTRPNPQPAKSPSCLIFIMRRAGFPGCLAWRRKCAIGPKPLTFAIAFERSLPPETCRFLSLFGAFRGASDADLLSYQCLISNEPGKLDERTKMFRKDDTRGDCFEPTAKAIGPSDTPTAWPTSRGSKMSKMPIDA